MSIFRKAGTTAALSVAGVGIAVGGVGLAGAQDTSGQAESPAASAGESGAQGQEGRRGHGHGGRGGDLRDRSGAALAEALGLDEADVVAAFSAAREQLSSDESADGERTRPTEDEKAEHRQRLAAALAAELDVTEDEVAAALDSLSEARAEAGRTSLSERLDTAVADGDLTESDRASVLKAFDAGVLGGERRGR